MAGLKAKPRFEVGDEHNEFTIVEYKGFEKQGNVQRQHRYLAQCSCGKTQEMSQVNLRYRIACKECVAATRQGVQNMRVIFDEFVLPEGCPDFRSMPLPGCVGFGHNA